VLRETTAATAIPVSRICSRERTLSVARARVRLAERAVNELGLSVSDVARRLAVSPSAVTLMLSRARRERENSKTQRTSPSAGWNVF